MAGSSRRPTLTLADDFGGMKGDAVARIPSSRIPELVAFCCAKKRELKNLEELLHRLQPRLITEAEAELRRHGIKDMPGNTWTFKDATGEPIEVQFPNQSLLSSFWIEDGKAYTKKRIGNKDEILPLGNLRKKAGKFFKLLFKPMFKPAFDAKNFRPIAKQHLGEKRGEELIAMMEFHTAPRCVYRGAKG